MAIDKINKNSCPFFLSVYNIDCVFSLEISTLIFAGLQSLGKDFFNIQQKVCHF